MEVPFKIAIALFMIGFGYDCTYLMHGAGFLLLGSCIPVIIDFFVNK